MCVCRVRLVGVASRDRKVRREKKGFKKFCLHATHAHIILYSVHTWISFIFPSPQTSGGGRSYTVHLHAGTSSACLYPSSFPIPRHPLPIPFPKLIGHLEGRVREKTISHTHRTSHLYNHKCGDKIYYVIIM